MSGVLQQSEPTFSVEFFPPKDQIGEDRLWSALRELHALHPDFVSVTYGAGGSTRDRTIKITSEITERTGLSTVAHLTCVGSSQAELRNILAQYHRAGITQILALRGDPPGGPASEWVPTPDGFTYADQLTALAKAEGFTVGVAAFPDGHPASHGNFAQDIDVLLRKEERGATFATTQFFFSIEKYIALVDALRKRGSTLPIIAGILPVTNVKQLKRMAELGGTPIPERIFNSFSSIQDDSEKVRARGIEIATKLCQQLITAKAPGLHFYTMNNASATTAIVKNLGLR